MNFDNVILSHYLYNEDYMRKVFPFLKEEYFQSKTHKIVYKLIHDFVSRYNTRPTREALYIDLGNTSGLSEDTFLKAQELIGTLAPDLETDKDWLYSTTESFCQENALHNAIRSGITILEGKDKTHLAGSLPQLFSDALSVSFDSKIGHDYMSDYTERFNFYNSTDIHIPFDIEELNQITKGGLLRKTLNCFMAPVGVGKTAVKCHLAASHVSLGYNVLYITMEMSEEKIAERIDANLLGVSLDDLTKLPKETYERKMQALQKKITGRLIIKEYPTGGASTANFRYLLGELKHKKNFIPDVIYVDYLNICASSRIKMGGGINTYIYVKTMAEELRGLAIESNTAIVTSTQVNRSGFADTDFDMDKTSDSWGAPAVFDLFLAVIRTEELDSLGQILFKQMKNRYDDKEKKKKFIIGFDRPHMRLYSPEISAQKNTIQTELTTHQETQAIPIKPKFTQSIQSNKSIFSEFK